MAERDFMNDLGRELAKSRFNNYTDNYDTIQLGAEPEGPPPMWRKFASEFVQGVRDIMKQTIGFFRPCLGPIRRAVYYYLLPRRYFAPHTKQYQDVSFLWILLGNQASRDLLVRLFAYRVSGHRKIRLPRNTPGYWSDIKNIEQYKLPVPPIKIKFMDAQLAQYDFSPLGFALKAYASGPGSACAFVQKQYEYHVGDIHCKVVPGDIAIDAGGCWGETTLYFAHEVGSQGRVVSFEFIPSNLAVMQANLAANPDLAKRVLLVEQPIWKHSGLALYYVDWGPGSRITEDEKQYEYDGTCNTTTIDDIVEGKSLPRVDFIKMDIEGAEFPALLGAERTIRKYRPKLAISLYHQLSDFVTIPRWLYELNLGYDFYLDHHTIYQNETVLFAIPRKSFAASPANNEISKAA